MEQLKQKSCFRVLKFVCLIVRSNINSILTFIHLHLCYNCSPLKPRLPPSLHCRLSDKYSIKKLRAHNRLKGTLSATPSTPLSLFLFSIFQVDFKWLIINSKKSLTAEFILSMNIECVFQSRKRWTQWYCFRNLYKQQ